MRKKNNLSLEDVKRKLNEIKGKQVMLEVNKGRKKFEYYSGIVENLYPSVFTVNISSDNKGIQSFSYSEVLCGNVIISEN